MRTWVVEAYLAVLVMKKKKEKSSNFKNRVALEELNENSQSFKVIILQLVSFFFFFWGILYIVLQFSVLNFDLHRIGIGGIE